MRSIIKYTLCTVVVVGLAAPAFTASADYYLKLGPVKCEAAGRATPAPSAVAGDQIEILSWSWGEARKGWDGSVKGASRKGWDGSVKGSSSAAKFGAVGGMHRDSGRVRVKVKFPWLGCKVGAAFPDAVLQNDAGRHELSDVVVSDCASDGVTLDYAKVTVRGWDPATKKK